jgi:hypothetical protein
MKPKVEVLDRNDARDVGDALRQHRHIRARRSNGVHIDGEFADREMPAAGSFMPSSKATGHDAMRS